MDGTPFWRETRRHGGGWATHLPQVRGQSDFSAASSRRQGLADIKRQIAYHEDALQDLWIQLMELRARVTAARRQIMGEDGDQ